MSLKIQFSYKYEKIESCSTPPVARALAAAAPFAMNVSPISQIDKDEN